MHPAYIVYPHEAAGTMLEPPLQGVRELAREQSSQLFRQSMCVLLIALPGSS
jgi:hypothetical protein